MIAALPPNEKDRLAALRELAILDTPFEEAYDRITRLAARLFRVPIALISLVDEGRQWFKSCHNFAARESGRELSFCAHAILSESVTVVPNALQDRRFADNALVTGSPGVRFYAGAPLKSPGGFNLGTLCIVDTVPRDFSDDEAATLKDLAAVVTDELELRASAIVRQQLVEHLDATVEKLTAAETMRDDLTHMIVHDLRNPVIGMIGLLDLVLQQAKERLHEDEARYLQVSKSSAEALNEMITSLLDVHRLEAGEMPLEISECDLRQVILTATETERAFSKDRLCLDLPPERVVVACDPKVICRVVTNLVSNAAKFTPPGKRIFVTLKPGKTHATACVSDEGPGIPPECLETIFDKFSQLESARQTHSTGLGLTFCKLALEAHRGSISVESEVGQGSCFSIRLPLVPAEVADRTSSHRARSVEPQRTATA
jgi:signal transduction histidine kinase